KTLWGILQKQWLMKSIEASDASFKVLASPTAIVGPDNANQRDNHANINFAHEGNEIREWSRKIPNLFVCTGDRHWQYQSTDLKTGLREFSCGPASDEHAVPGPGKDEKYHSFYRAKGGFLSVAVNRDNDSERIAFRF